MQQSYAAGAENFFYDKTIVLKRADNESAVVVWDSDIRSNRFQNN